MGFPCSKCRRELSSQFVCDRHFETCSTVGLEGDCLYCNKHTFRMSTHLNHCKAYKMQSIMESTTGQETLAQSVSDNITKLRELKDKHLPAIPQYVHDSVYGPVRGTKQAGHETALSFMLSRAHPPRTTIDQEIRTLESVLEGSHDIGQNLAQATPCDITFIPPGTEQEKEVAAALREGRFPIFAPGFNPTACEMTLTRFCKDMAGMPNGDTFADVNDASFPEEPTFGVLPPKNPDSTAKDSASEEEKADPRPSNSSEFVDIFEGRQQREQPLNYLDLRNSTKLVFTPEVVRLESLDYPAWNEHKATASKINNAQVRRMLEEFFIATTKDGFSYAHRDKAGYCTWAMMTEGVKLWLIPRQTDSLAADFDEHGPRNLPIMDWQEWVGVKLTPGDLWIQGPGQIHGVWTLCDSLMVGGQFWTSTSFARTINLVGVGEWENESILDRDWATLAAILEKQCFDTHHESRVYAAITRMISADDSLDVSQLKGSKKDFFEAALKLKDLSPMATKRSWDAAIGNPVLNDGDVPTAQPPPEDLPPQKSKARQNPKSSGSRKPQPKKKK